MADHAMSDEEPNDETPSDEKLSVAVLGTGIMGFPIARRLAEAGHRVSAWNRHRDKADPLREHGVRVADAPADAVAEADMVVTMLSDADAVAEVMGQAVDSLGDDTIWAQMSTVGEPGWRALARLAEEHGVVFVDAPVLGTRKPAEDGALKVLASGPDEALERCAPAFDVLGTTVPELGAAGTGSRLKLAANLWVLALTDTTAAALALLRAFGLDGELFLRAIDGTASDSPYAQLKGRAMLGGDYAPSFPAAGAAKDARLIGAAARSLDLDTALIDALTAHFEAAVDAGHGEDDMGAVYVAHVGEE
jgi:3-hydroxyisobutyrate dehydrogenase